MKKTEKTELQKAFDNLSNRQQINAIKFGSLSDFHLSTLRALLDNPMTQGTPELRKFFYEIYLATEYTGTAPFGGGPPNEKEYAEWNKNRVKAD